MNTVSHIDQLVYLFFESGIPDRSFGPGRWGISSPQP
jgi:hypothetical protein